MEPEDQRPFPSFCYPESVLTVKEFLIFAKEVGRDRNNLGLIFFPILLTSFQQGPKKRDLGVGGGRK